MERSITVGYERFSVKKCMISEIFKGNPAVKKRKKVLFFIVIYLLSWQIFITALKKKCVKEDAVRT